jgi:hypothetical protein
MVVLMVISVPRMWDNHAEEDAISWLHRCGSLASGMIAADSTTMANRWETRMCDDEELFHGGGSASLAARPSVVYTALAAQSVAAIGLKL